MSLMNSINTNDIRLYGIFLLIYSNLLIFAKDFSLNLESFTKILDISNKYLTIFHK